MINNFCKGVENLDNIVSEILFSIYVIIMIITSGVYLRQLEKARKHRALTAFERTMYILIQVSYLLFAASLLISVFT